MSDTIRDVMSSEVDNIKLKDHAVKLVAAITGDTITPDMVSVTVIHRKLYINLVVGEPFIEVSLDGILYHPNARVVVIGDNDTMLLPDSIPRFQDRMKADLSVKALAAISRQYHKILVRLPR